MGVRIGTLTAGLILMRIDWWEKNRWRFLVINFEDRLDARYAKKISKFSKAAYLVDPEQRILQLKCCRSRCGFYAADGQGPA